MSRAARLNLKSKIITVAVATLAVAGGLSFYETNSAQKTANEPANKPVATQTEIKSESEVISYVGEQGKTALELLNQNAEVETEQTDFGPMVTSINGRDGGGEKFWMFYVDGKMAEVGAAEFETKDGQEIEWKLQ